MITVYSTNIVHCVVELIKLFAWLYFRCVPIKDCLTTLGWLKRALDSMKHKKKTEL